MEPGKKTMTTIRVGDLVKMHDIITKEYYYGKVDKLGIGSKLAYIIWEGTLSPGWYPISQLEKAKIDA